MKINVLGYTYKINAYKTDIDKEDEFKFGEANFVIQSIYINTNNKISDKKLRETIIHEITHAYHAEYCDGQEFKDNSEFVATFVSKFIDSILADAEKVYAYRRSCYVGKCRYCKK